MQLYTYLCISDAAECVAGGALRFEEVDLGLGVLGFLGQTRLPQLQDIMSNLSKLSFNLLLVVGDEREVLGLLEITLGEGELTLSSSLLRMA